MMLWVQTQIMPRVDELAQTPPLLLELPGQGTERPTVPRRAMKQGARQRRREHRRQASANRNSNVALKT